MRVPGEDLGLTYPEVAELFAAFGDASGVDIPSEEAEKRMREIVEPFTAGPERSARDGCVRWQRRLND
jgi:hypothetical protein